MSCVVFYLSSFKYFVVLICRDDHDPIFTVLLIDSFLLGRWAHYIVLYVHVQAYMFIKCTISLLTKPNFQYNQIIYMETSRYDFVFGVTSTSFKILINLFLILDVRKKRFLKLPLLIVDLLTFLFFERGTEFYIKLQNIIHVLYYVVNYFFGSFFLWNSYMLEDNLVYFLLLYIMCGCIY